MSLKMGTDIVLPFTINQTDLLAGTGFEIVAPVNGVLTDLLAVVQAAITTGGDITVQVNGVAVTGLSVTFANAATKGTVQKDTSASGTTRKVVKGDRITVIPSAAFDTAGAVNGSLVLNTGLGL